MKRANEHSRGRVDAYVRALRRANAPDLLVTDFLDLVAIDNAIVTEPDKSLESLDRLLLDSCKKFNWVGIFDSHRGRAWLRPNLVASGHPESFGDCAWGNDIDPREEQAYRRGFHQGFADAVRLTSSESKAAVKERDRAITRWRFAPIWFGATPPGTVEEFGLKVSIRSVLPKKLRWEILNRDGLRCVACGARAANGATLHIDHKVSLFNGGTNDAENLQTLCDECNIGKGKD